MQTNETDVLACEQEVIGLARKFFCGVLPKNGEHPPSYAEVRDALLALDRAKASASREFHVDWLEHRLLDAGGDSDLMIIHTPRGPLSWYRHAAEKLYAAGVRAPEDPYGRVRD